MTLLDNMPHRATHVRPRYEEQDDLSDLAKLESVAAGVECWVQNAGRNDVIEYGKRDQRVTHKVFFNGDPALRVGDRLTITSGPSHVGADLKFLAISDRSAGLGVLWGGMFEEETNVRPTSHGN